VDLPLETRLEEDALGIGLPRRIDDFELFQTSDAEALVALRPAQHYAELDLET
jgi:hypothetical protein